jgi:TFIIF-interacting CTD phosphatase-like protein
MSKTTKFYAVRDRLNRYRKAVKDIFRSRYYTESSRSHKRKLIAEDRIINAEVSQQKNETSQPAINPIVASSPEAKLHVHHRLDRPC